MAQQAFGGAERAEIRAKRAVAAAETERDSMAVRLAQRGEAADAALAEAHAMGERRRREADGVRAHAESEMHALEAVNGGLRAQLSEVASAAAGLQELLLSQQRVAEAYRAEAAAWPCRFPNAPSGTSKLRLLPHAGKSCASFTTAPFNEASPWW